MSALKSAFPELFREFLQSYPLTPAGQQHVAAYPLQRQSGQQNYERVLAAIATNQHITDQDITDQVLLTLLPYTRSPKNQQRGAWVHIAPSLAGDIKLKFEAAGWTKPEGWPQIARALWQLVNRCYDHPDQLVAACADFSANPVTKGFQTGMVTPILNALRPDEFLLINNKSRSVINTLAGTDYGQKLQDYPAINATGRALIQSLQSQIGQLLSDHLPDRPPLRDDDWFDMFCHWVVAVRKHPLVAQRETRYWKIAPGEQGWQWDEALSEGFIGLGWEAMGDVSGLDQQAFAQRRELVIKANPDLATQPGWSVPGLKQLWEFAQIQVGDRIIANRGTQEILGVGTVTRPYYFLPNVRHGHRLDVDWDQVAPWAVNEPSWVKTLIPLTLEKFQALVNKKRQILTATNWAEFWAEFDASSQGQPSAMAYWIFQATPYVYDLPSALSKLTTQTWLVRQYKDQIHAGDRAFFWNQGLRVDCGHWQKF